ncbi:transporter substrate-binding domain-containing protein [Roseateles sp.]|uniref:substrate-binding periplasmic protein n=1 Tax=Roseateles sp. TaxID=1971397 RepID=UPI003264DBB6
MPAASQAKVLNRSAWVQQGRFTLVAVALAWVGASSAEPPPLRIVAPTNQSMPLLRMVQNKPVDGLLKDLGELLAKRLGLSDDFLPFPSKRAARAVASGAADLLCYVKPEWFEDKLLWTRPFLSGTGIIAAGLNAAAVVQLRDLRDERLGTVLGYRYPVLDQAFGQDVRREDAADAETNLRRLALGRIHYAVTDRAALDHFKKMHPEPELREVIEVEHYQLGCALSPHKANLLQPLNRAIDQILADGSLAKLLNRYR